MKKNRSMSLKDQITIQIKRTRPIHWAWYAAVCVVLMAALFLLGTFPSRTAEADVPASLAQEDNQMRVTVLGEIEITDTIRALANKTSYASLLGNLSGYWADSDHVAASVSGPVLTYAEDQYTSTRSLLEESVYLRPAALRGFAQAGLDVLNFASDDAYNYGATGLKSTFRELENYGIYYTGIAQTSKELPYQLLTFETGTDSGETQTRAMAIMGINNVIQRNSTVQENRAGVINSSIETLYTTVYEASQSADLTMVYIHSGTEDDREITEDEQEFARMLIDVGADIVVGAHSHMVQSMEYYNGGLILYGLGNVFSDADYSLALDSAMLDVVVSNSGEIYAYVTPLRICDGRPQITQNAYYWNRIIHILTENLSTDEYSVTEDHQLCISLGRLEDTPVYQADDSSDAEIGQNADDGPDAG